MALEFDKEERNTIAEFIYSYDNDILIKSDALKLIDVFENKGITSKLYSEQLRNMVENQSSEISQTLMNKIVLNTTDASINKIMKEYYGNT